MRTTAHAIIMVFKNSLILVGIFAVSILPGCRKEGIQSELAEIPPAMETSYARRGGLTGEDLFRSLFFARGTLADNMESLDDARYFFNTMFDDSTREGIIAVQERILERLIEDEPEFLDQFKEQILTGEHEIVSEAFMDGYNRLFNSMAAEFEISEVDTTDMNDFESKLISHQQDISELYQAYKANSVSKEEFVAQMKEIFQEESDRFSERRFACIVIGIVFALVIDVAIVAAIVGYVALALGVHTVVGVRMYVVYTTKIKVYNSRPSNPHVGNSLEYENLINDIVMNTQ